MGKIFSRLIYPLRQFNLEERAFKRISREKPEAAPRHPKTEALLKQVSTEADDIKGPPNPNLLGRLKDVYVTSHDHEDLPRFDSKPLPILRTPVNLGVYGIPEPEVIPPGKISLRLAQAMLSKSQAQESITPEQLAEEYNLKLEDTNSILQHFSTLIDYSASNENSSSNKLVFLIKDKSEDKSKHKEDKQSAQQMDMLEPNR